MNVLCVNAPSLRPLAAAVVVWEKAQRSPAVDEEKTLLRRPREEIEIWK